MGKVIDCDDLNALSDDYDDVSTTVMLKHGVPSLSQRTISKYQLPIHLEMLLNHHSGL